VLGAVVAGEAVCEVLLLTSHKPYILAVASVLHCPAPILAVSAQTSLMLRRMVSISGCLLVCGLLIVGQAAARTPDELLAGMP
jgi:hypothetical protein